MTDLQERLKRIIDTCDEKVSEVKKLWKDWPGPYKMPAINPEILDLISSLATVVRKHLETKEE